MSYCPYKFNIKPIRNPNLVDPNLWQCEGSEREFFNVDYGRCCKYVETLTIDERVKLEHSNERRK